MSGPLAERIRHTFRALGHREYRVYWVGQAVSVTGTWMQTVAQSWLLYRLTDSPLALGFLAAARFGPSLFLSPVAGVLTDRFRRRTIVLLTQAASLVQASVLAALTLAGAIEVWHILVLALGQGIVDTLDMPARQTLQVDLVGVEDLQSAVSLNSTAFNGARMVGPAVAGVLVAAYGEGVCFAVNAASYLAVLLALLALRLPPATTTTGGSIVDELREGLAFAWREPGVRAALGAVSVTSALGLSYSTLLPVLARDVLGGGVQGYGLLLAGAGIGAITGALASASRRGTAGTGTVIPLAQGALGAALVALGSTRSLTVATGVMVLVGLAVALQLATTNGFLQVIAPPRLRGRLVSLYIWLFVGMSPLGGLAAGWLAERVGAPRTAWVAGVACLASAVVTLSAMAGRRPDSPGPR